MDSFSISSSFLLTRFYPKFVSRKIGARSAELRTEQSRLLETLRASARMLRAISPDLDRLLDIEADPRGCADALDAMVRHVEAAGGRIDELPWAPKTADRQHEIAVELAQRVLPMLEGYGILPSATACTRVKMVDVTRCDASESRYASTVVEILKLVADDMGLFRSEATWRDMTFDRWRLIVGHKSRP